MRMNEVDRDKVAEMDENVRSLKVKEDSEINWYLFNEDVDENEQPYLFNLKLILNNEDPTSNLRLKMRNDKQIVVNVNLFSLMYLQQNLTNALMNEIDFDELSSYASSEAIVMLKQGQKYAEGLLSKNRDVS